MSKTTMNLHFDLTITLQEFSADGRRRLDTPITQTFTNLEIDTKDIPEDETERQQWLKAHLARAISRYHTNQDAIYYDMLEEEADPFWWKNPKNRRKYDDKE